MTVSVEISIQYKLLNWFIVLNWKCDIILICIHSHFSRELWLRFSDHTDRFHSNSLIKRDDKNHLPIAVWSYKALFIKPLLVRFNNLATGILLFFIETLYSLQKHRWIKIICIFSTLILFTSTCSTMSMTLHFE